MYEDPSQKQCAILLAMGGPQSTDEVRDYLYNIFSDRGLIQLPGGRLFQKPFAKMISRLRTKKVQAHYSLIGGGSPLLKWTQAQADLIESNIKTGQDSFRCYVAMRYTGPSIEESIMRAYRDGFRRMCFVPMYPQYSAATTGSSFREAGRVLEGLPDVQATFIKDFHDDPSYIALLKDYIDRNIGDDDTLLFSAHSLPQRFVDEGDPYVDQVKKAAELAAGDREYFVSFQSRTGPVDWVGPDTVEETKRLLAERVGNLFVVPIAFVCDHIETLYEIDIELRQLVGDGSAGRIRRMPMFNDDPKFAGVLRGIISKRVLSNVKG